MDFFKNNLVVRSKIIIYLLNASKQFSNYYMTYTLNLDIHLKNYSVNYLVII